MDRRITRTKELIRSTFQQMVCEMDYRNIKVKELSDRAGIHRKTFYWHYETIDSLLDEILEEIFHDYTGAVDKLERPFSMTALTRVFFEFFSSQKPYVEHLMFSSGYEDFYYRFSERAIRHNRKRYDPYPGLDRARLNLIDTYVLTGTLELYRQWVRDGKVLSLEDAIDMAGKLLNNGVEAFYAGK